MMRFAINGINRAFFPQSLRRQLLSRSLFILSLLLLLIGFFQYVLMSQFLYKNTAETIRAQVQSMLPQMIMHFVNPPREPHHENNHDINSPRFIPFVMPNATITWITASGQMKSIYPLSGNSTALRLPLKDYQQFMAGNIQPGGYQLALDKNGNQIMIVLVPTGFPRQSFGLVQVTTPVHPLQVQLWQQLFTFIGLSVVALGAGLLIFSRTLNKAFVPLNRMIETVGRINAGNLQERLTTEQAQTEIELLSNSFNAMLERLDGAFSAELAANERMRQFVSDASHELRTPLTAINGFLEVLLRGAANNPEQIRKALVTMHAESERMTKLVTDLLLLSRLDNEPGLERMEGRLSDLLLNMESQLRMLAGERQVHIHLAKEPSLNFDQDKMKQVVLNLFHNAVQHTHPQLGRIDLSVSVDGDGVSMQVEDNGEGIAPEHLTRLFERFYRVDEARSRKQGGAGLGLPISQAIVQGHGGEIRCQSEPGLRTVFSVWLPFTDPLLALESHSQCSAPHTWPDELPCQAGKSEFP